MRSDLAELKKRGHQVVTWPDWAWKAGGVCVIVINEGHRDNDGWCRPEKRIVCTGLVNGAALRGSAAGKLIFYLAWFFFTVRLALPIQAMLVYLTGSPR